MTTYSRVNGIEFPDRCPNCESQGRATIYGDRIEVTFECGAAQTLRSSGVDVRGECRRLSALTQGADAIPKPE